MRAEEIQISRALEVYEAHMRTRNLSPLTINCYLKDLRRLVGTIGDLPLGEIDGLVLMMAQSKLCADLKANSQGRVITSWRVFFQFCRKRLGLKVNPSEDIERPKTDERLPVFLAEPELLAVLGTCDTATAVGTRDLAILTLLANTGMRIGEFTSLRFSNFNFETRTVTVFGKGRKERKIPLNSCTLRALDAWLKVRPECDHDFIFVQMRGRGAGKGYDSEPLLRKGIQTLLKRKAKACRIDKPITPHKLRHTFATLLHSHRVDILEIKELLGHRNVSTTMIYTHTNVEHLRAAVDRLPEMGGVIPLQDQIERTG